LAAFQKAFHYSSCVTVQVTDSLKVLESTTGADGAALKAVMERAVADSSYVEEKGQKLTGFRYLSAAEANKIVAERRKQVGGKGRMAAHEKSVCVCGGGRVHCIIMTVA
jgi:hypothetical protein